MDIGVMGGTFDPIHLGHLVAAEEVRYQLGLDEIIFVPAGQPWLKADRQISPAAHRLEMVSLAIADNPLFKISTVDIDSPGPTYTVDTIDRLKDEIGAEARIFFLIGSDALVDLPRWKEPSRLVQLCRLVAFNRPGTELPSLGWLESVVPGVSHSITFVDVSQMDISATQIRLRAARGDSLEGLVPLTVERYILEQGLYRQ